MNWKINATVISILMISISRLYEVSGENFKSTDESPNITKTPNICSLDCLNGGVCRLDNCQLTTPPCCECSPSYLGDRCEIRARQYYNIVIVVEALVYDDDLANTNSQAFIQTARKFCGLLTRGMTRKQPLLKLSCRILRFFNGSVGAEIIISVGTDSLAVLIPTQLEITQGIKENCLENMTQCKEFINENGKILSQLHINEMETTTTSPYIESTTTPPIEYGPWSVWTPCTFRCNLPSASRKKHCLKKDDTPVQNCFSEEKKMCNNTVFPPALFWGSWSNWSSCSANCGASSRTRKRLCVNEDLIPYDNCFGEERRECITPTCPPAELENFKWDNWSEWSNCSSQCGNGLERRRKSCLTKDNRLYDNCFGEITRPCNLKECEPKFAGWLVWSACSVTCGSGLTIRKRQCLRDDNSLIANCYREESTTCSTPACPPDIQFGEWESWSSCSATCGESIQIRRKNCLNKDGTVLENCFREKKRSCPTPNCTQALILGSWMSWSLCSATCGPSKKRRRKMCFDDLNNQIENCFKEEFKNCNTNLCPPENLKWANWASWSGCTAKCGFEKDSRRRKCLSKNGTLYENCFGEESQICSLPKCKPDADCGDNANSYLNEISQLKSYLLQNSSMISALKAALLNKDYIKLLELNPGLASQSSTESSSFPLHAFSENCTENSAITELEINPYWTIKLDEPHLISSIHVGVLEENAADFQNIFVVVSNKAGDTDTSRKCHHFVGPVIFNGALVMNCGKLGSHVTILQEGTARLRLCQLKVYEEVFQWTVWSKYSECSVTCGKGLKTRERYCIRINGQSGDDCSEQQRRVCNRDCSPCSEVTPETSTVKPMGQTSLNAGEITGIVIGSLLVIGLIAGSFVLWLLCARRNDNTTNNKQIEDVNLKSQIGPTMTPYKPQEWVPISRPDYEFKGYHYDTSDT